MKTWTTAPYTILSNFNSGVCCVNVLQHRDVNFPRITFFSHTCTNTYIIHSFVSLYVPGQHLIPDKTRSEPVVTSSPSDPNHGWLTNAFIPSTGVHLLQLEQAGHKTNTHQAWLVAAQIDKVFPSVKSSLMTESFDHQTFRVKHYRCSYFPIFALTKRSKERKAILSTIKDNVLPQ